MLVASDIRVTYLAFAAVLANHPSANCTLYAAFLTLKTTTAVGCQNQAEYLHVVVRSAQRVYAGAVTVLSELDSQLPLGTALALQFE